MRGIDVDDLKLFKRVDDVDRRAAFQHDANQATYVGHLDSKGNHFILLEVKVIPVLGDIEVFVAPHIPASFQKVSPVEYQAPFVVLKILVIIEHHDETQNVFLVERQVEPCVELGR